MRRRSIWSTSFGVPVSTTHTITGAIMGESGAARRVSAVRWGIAGSIIIAWVITLPTAALIGALFDKCVALFTAATPLKVALLLILVISRRRFVNGLASGKKCGARAEIEVHHQTSRARTGNAYLHSHNQDQKNAYDPY